MVQVTISGDKKQIAEGISVMILSLVEKEPILNAFHIENGEVRKEFLEIVEGE